MPIRRVLLAASAAALSAVVAFAAAPAAEACTRAQHARIEPLQIKNAAGKVIDLKVQFVDKEASRDCGLMFRRSLAPNEGMLFDFKAPQPVNFWMKNTYIPLDLLFIDKNGRVVNIFRQATPFSEAEIPSDGPVLGVLEIAGGRAQDLDIMPGDMVRHRIFTAH